MIAVVWFLVLTLDDGRTMRVGPYETWNACQVQAEQMRPVLAECLSTITVIARDEQKEENT
jgi:hypothetical protein